MTLNNVISRIKQIALSHKQVRNWKYGLVSDFLNDHTTKYPSVFLQDNGGKISTTNGQATTLSFRMFIMDLVHVSEDTKDNEQDVHSDVISIAMDLITQMNMGDYQDWALSDDNNLTLVVEEQGDMFAGCIIDFSLRIMFKQDRCQIPSDLTIVTDDDMKNVYDVEYIANGTEGNTIDTSVKIPEITGKKILLITRESAPIYKVSSNPDPAEFVWNNTILTLGTVTAPNERFLILYRTY
jgi:hypothetical protein